MSIGIGTGTLPGADTRFLVVMDVDSTLIENEVIELLADAAGSLAAVAEITERAMAGELDFEHSLRERVRTLAGLPVTVFAEAAEHVRLTPGARRLIEVLHDTGSRVAVVSGGFHEILDPFAEELQLDFWRANRLEVEDGRLTGGLVGPIIDARAKQRALEEWAGECGVPHDRVVAVGDGANDLLMMDAAGLSVAFNAKPRVRSHADVIMDVCDLSQVLPLLGLRG
jgi:phosphoserine phosphatase